MSTLEIYVFIKLILGVSRTYDVTKKKNLRGHEIFSKGILVISQKKNCDSDYAKNYKLITMHAFSISFFYFL